MADRANITPELCRQLLRYDAGSGKLFWRPRSAQDFNCSKYDRVREAKRWNARHADKEAFPPNARGYGKSYINGSPQLAHNIVWLMKFGCWPKGILDHIDGDTGNNRLSNLRDVTQTENARNACKRSDNTSGYTGVSWCKRKGAWLARMCLNGRNKHIGYFPSAEAAAEARKIAAAPHFHENHGRSAC